LRMMEVGFEETAQKKINRRKKQNKKSLRKMIKNKLEGE
jgi:hypothetical protein